MERWPAPALDAAAALLSKWTRLRDTRPAVRILDLLLDALRATYAAAPGGRHSLDVVVNKALLVHLSVYGELLDLGQVLPHQRIVLAILGQVPLERARLLEL